MSAYRVENTHIDALLTAATSADIMHDHHTPFLTFQHRDIKYKATGLGLNELGRALIDLNNRAVNTRYNENEAPTPYTFTRLNTEIITPVMVLKLINGLRYQCAEFTGWNDTLGAAFLTALEAVTIRALPGYDDAPWTLHNHDEFLTYATTH